MCMHMAMASAVVEMKVIEEKYSADADPPFRKSSGS